jgi:hypothetical protein
VALARVPVARQLTFCSGAPASPRAMRTLMAWRIVWMTAARGLPAARVAVCGAWSWETTTSASRLARSVARGLSVARPLLL